MPHFTRMFVFSMHHMNISTYILLNVTLYVLTKIWNILRKNITEWAHAESDLKRNKYFFL